MLKPYKAEDMTFSKDGKSFRSETTKEQCYPVPFSHIVNFLLLWKTRPGPQRHEFVRTQLPKFILEFIFHCEN